MMGMELVCKEFFFLGEEQKITEQKPAQPSERCAHNTFFQQSKFHMV
jgi:hypothetical protein